MESSLIRLGERIENPLAASGGVVVSGWKFWSSMSERILIVRSNTGNTHFLTLIQSHEELEVSTEELQILHQTLQEYLQSEAPYLSVDIQSKGTDEAKPFYKNSSSRL